MPPTPAIYHRWEKGGMSTINVCFAAAAANNAAYAQCVSACASEGVVLVAAHKLQ